MRGMIVAWVLATAAGSAAGQVPPSAAEAERYSGLHAAAHRGDVAAIQKLVAAVADDEETLRLLLSLGASAKLVTSRYDGTALIAAAHLGDGGARHQATLRALVQAGANLQLPDRQGHTPLALARGRGYREMARMLEEAGAR